MKENSQPFFFYHLFSILDSVEPFGPESFDPEFTTEGLTADGLIEGCSLYLSDT